MVAALFYGVTAGLAMADPPRIAIIIDDLGYNRAHGEAVLALPGALTCAVIPETPFARRLGAQAARAGKEVMIHLPMAALDARHLDAGAINDTMSQARIAAVLDQARATLPAARGVNNHMGSALTAEHQPMRRLMSELGKRHLYFLDSRTSAATVAERTARQQGVATGRRDVFLDNQRDFARINDQFNKLLELARQRGHAIAIGHPYPETIAYLRQVLPVIEQAGVRLVPVSALLHTPKRHTAATPTRPPDDAG
ncbi:hypothetical protein CEK62_20530 (plasmid) [Alcanivorax sp. N3-2A]|nr:hypothetical protein CEK62_00340 [Alcanivorax sp. N3-2A]ASK36753.1 hypothetical protein CEK62_20530 [Alcanivorax sp. N3-2A]